MDDKYFIERLNIPVTGEFREAVRKAAERQDLSVADYARLALGSRMARDGIPFSPVPVLHRQGIPGRRGRP